MIGLVLEGGGMRGAFTAGVLDYWMSENLYFQNVIGVSAGACQACSYLCHQPGRGIRVWLNYLNDPRFMSFRSLLTTGDLFGAELNYDLVPRRLDPLDNDTFVRSGVNFTVVVTDVVTGQPVYLPVHDMMEDMAAIRASASLPLISNLVRCGDRLCLDGGVSDSIPVRHAFDMGCDRNVIVLTQPREYRKTPNKALTMMRLRYHRYPKLIEAVAKRHIQYNDTLDYIAQQEQAGKLFVLRPDSDPGVGRTEKDPAKLQRLHDMGFEAAQREHDRLMAFLSI